MDESTGWGRPIAIGLAGAFMMFGIGFRRAPPATVAPRRSANELLVPHARGPIVIDGNASESDWARTSAKTGAFVAADSKAAQPLSEARALWDDTHLYLFFDAADQDIRVAKVEPDGPVWKGAAFTLSIRSAEGGKHSIAVGPTGVLTDAAVRAGMPLDYAWHSAAKVAATHEGTLDDPSDHDEKWAVEVAIPWQALGMAPAAGVRIGIVLRRCDLPASARGCGSWGAAFANGVFVLTR